jgi:hypothetical protein
MSSPKRTARESDSKEKEEEDGMGKEEREVRRKGTREQIKGMVDAPSTFSDFSLLPLALPVSPSSLLHLSSFPSALPFNLPNSSSIFFSLFSSRLNTPTSTVPPPTPPPEAISSACFSSARFFNSSTVIPSKTHSTPVSRHRRQG